VRSAGFDAYSVYVASRQDNLFNPKFMRISDLSGNAVLVKLNGKDLFFDPGTIFTSYGLLPWGETGVQALKLDKDGGTWVDIPYPDSSVSQIVHKADLKISSQGSLEGKLTITYSGDKLRTQFVRRVQSESAFLGLRRGAPSAPACGAV